MYDIVPSSSPEESQLRKRKRGAARVHSNNDKAIVHAGSRVVQIEWKLPARLRKPVRQQLAKERAQRQRRQRAAVTFARKPIQTQNLLEADPDIKRAGARVKKPKNFFNRGVEHHTTDMYTQGKPQLHVAAPPYMGRVVRRNSAPKPSQPQVRTEEIKRQSVAVRPAAPRRRMQPVRDMRVAPAQPMRRRFAREGTSDMPLTERDVPMQWEKNGRTPAQTQPEDELFVHVKQKRAVTPAVTFSLWPGNWFGRNEANEDGTPLRSSSPAGESELRGVSRPGLAAKKKLLIS